MNGSSDSQCMLFLSPASEPPTLFVEDMLFTLYVAPWFALPARPPSSPTSADRSGSEQWSRSSRQPAPLPVLFHIWPCRPRALQNYFLMEPTPQTLRHVCSVCFSSSQRLFVIVPSFYVKCFGCSAKSTSCLEEHGGRQLWHVYFNDLQDDQEWFFSVKKSGGAKHAHISHPLKGSKDKWFTFSNLILKIYLCELNRFISCLQWLKSQLKAFEGRNFLSSIFKLNSEMFSSQSSTITITEGFLLLWEPAQCLCPVSSKWMQRSKQLESRSTFE